MVGVAAASVAGVLAFTTFSGPGLFGAGNRAPESGPATGQSAEYDPQAMPQIIDDAVRNSLSPGVPALPDGTVKAYDVEGNVLPSQHYDKANGWVGDYDWDGHHLFSTELLHAGSEAEGDHEQVCADDVAAGDYLTCDVHTSDVGVVVTRTGAIQRAPAGWWRTVRDLSTADPDTLWFQRQVETIRSETLVVRSTETVKAADLESARQEWRVPVADLERIATHPDLEFPPAPIDPKTGCTWTLRVEPEGGQAPDRVHVTG